jgi:hypothetical protein
MIHHLYVGHFIMTDGVMKLEQRKDDGAIRPIVARPLDQTVVRRLLGEKGVNESTIPEDWWLGIDDEGFIVCQRDSPNRDAIDFIRCLAATTKCDVFYDGILALSPEELTTP